MVGREGEVGSPELALLETAAPSFVNFRRNNQGGLVLGCRGGESIHPVLPGSYPSGIGAKESVFQTDGNG